MGKKKKGVRDTHIALRIICWHIEVGDHHVCHFNNSNVKPLVLLLYDWFHRGGLRFLFLEDKHGTDGHISFLCDPVEV